jgi:hypothetical protein
VPSAALLTHKHAAVSILRQTNGPCRCINTPYDHESEAWEARAALLLDPVRLDLIMQEVRLLFSAVPLRNSAVLPA